MVCSPSAGDGVATALKMFKDSVYSGDGLPAVSFRPARTSVSLSSLSGVGGGGVLGESA